MLFVVSPAKKKLFANSNLPEKLAFQQYQGLLA